MPSGRARPAPPLRAVEPALAFAPSALVDALAALAGSGSCADVADALSASLLELDGVRAAAVLSRHEGAALVVGSAGYSCDTMTAGARLPLDSGLPAAEAIRTGQLVRQGTGPGWCAVPFGRRTTAPGALLLSLTCAPPAAPADVARLHRLATALDGALVRARRFDRAAEDLARLLAGLAPSSGAHDPDVAIRQSAVGGTLGGDVLLALADGRAGQWLVVADVCGSGLPAATGAAAVRVAVRALAPLAESPAHLLQLLDAALRPEAPDGAFITAAVAHVRDGELVAASAGHPAPWLLASGRPVPLAVEPGPPIALETIGTLPLVAELTVATPPGALLVLYSDGLTDRRGPDASELDIAVLLDAARASTSPAEVADALMAAADASAPAADDTSVLVSRLPD